MRAGVDVMGRLLPNCRTAVMPGQRHIAMYAAPDLFVHEVVTFLTGLV